MSAGAGVGVYTPKRCFGEMCMLEQLIPTILLLLPFSASQQVRAQSWWRQRQREGVTVRRKDGGESLRTVSSAPCRRSVLRSVPRGCSSLSSATWSAPRALA